MRNRSFDFATVSQRHRSEVTRWFRAVVCSPILICNAVLIGLLAWLSPAELRAVDTPQVDAELYYNPRVSTTAFGSPVVEVPDTTGSVLSNPDLRGPILSDPVFGDPVRSVPVLGGRPYEASSWQLLPDGLIYRSYMAGAHEPRLSGTPYWDKDNTRLLDIALGGRVGLIRYGTTNNLRPEGWQLDIEGAAFPRLNLDEDWDMEAADFRAGLPLTFGHGNWQVKFAYYHLSSHLGDEFAIRNPGSLASRINYSRDALVLGASYYVTPAARFYAESGWAFYMDGGSEPWEFQFGVDWSAPGVTGVCGTPFLAINGHLREELNFGGNLVVQGGWLWRGPSGHTFRTGLHYYNGKSSQFQFFNQFEQQLGLGAWYDY